MISLSDLYRLFALRQRQDEKKKTTTTTTPKASPAKSLNTWWRNTVGPERRHRLLWGLSCRQLSGCTISTRFYKFLITKRDSKCLCGDWGLGNRLFSKHFSKQPASIPNPPGRLHGPQHTPKASRNHDPTVSSVVQLPVSTCDIQPPV